MRAQQFPELIQLKALLKQKKLSYRKLAEQTGMGTNTLCDKLNGYTAFTTDEVRLLIKLLNIPYQMTATYFIPEN